MNLGEYLKRSGLALSEFAEKVGVTHASMSRYVSGKRLPRPEILRRIADASGGEVRANDFFADAAEAAPGDAVAAFRADHPEAAMVDMLLCDMVGMLRGKRFPVGALAKLFSGGVTMPGSTFALDVTGANVDATGTGMPDGDPDYVCRPVPGTLAPVPWAAPPAGQVLASMYHDDGRPFRLDPRHVLGRVAARFRDLGLTPVVALELEFYLLDRERDAAGRPQLPISHATGRRAADIQVFAIDDLEDASAVIDDIAAACAAQSIPANVALAEYAPSQYEINLEHQPDPVAAGDHAVLLKRAVKGTARRHGLEATFMAKPFAGELSANGMHIHVSLLERDGRNAFDDAADDGDQRLRHAIGGLRATMAEAMAIFAPNSNSYRRFLPGSYAPMAPAWGYDNRTVALRVPAARGAARRIEHRTAGADANPYLATAAVLAGIHHGLTRGLDPGPPTTGNAYRQHAASLPLHWLDALRAFDRAQVLPEYLGPDYCRVYAACKWRDMDLFNARITAAEYEWYLRAL